MDPPKILVLSKYYICYIWIFPQIKPDVQGNISPENGIQIRAEFISVYFILIHIFLHIDSHLGKMFITDIP